MEGRQTASAGRQATGSGAPVVSSSGGGGGRDFVFPRAPATVPRTRFDHNTDPQERAALEALRRQLDFAAPTQEPALVSENPCPVAFEKGGKSATTSSVPLSRYLAICPLYYFSWHQRRWRAETINLYSVFDQLLGPSCPSRSPGSSTSHLSLSRQPVQGPASTMQRSSVPTARTGRAAEEHPDLGAIHERIREEQHMLAELEAKQQQLRLLQARVRRVVQNRILNRLEGFKF